MKEKPKSINSDLKRIDELSDNEIDYSDIPPLDESFFTKTTVQLPKRKSSITLRIDRDTLEWFRNKGKGYQTLINAVLAAYVNAHK